MENQITEQVDRLAARLLQLNIKLGTAESCTGGWISKVCTDVAGSSAWFERGFVTYSNEAKMELLGVKSETLERHGAVSREVAEEMAMGALARSPVQASIAVTGIAGPDGGSDEKPVGTVWFGWGLPGSSVTSECVVFEGDRCEVRRQTVIHALEGLTRHLG